MEAYMLQSVPATTGQTALLHVKCDLGSKTVQQLRISCVTCSVRIIVRTPSHRPSSVQVHARLQLQDLTNTASHLHTARPIPAIVPPPHTGLPTFYLCTYRVPTNTLQTCSQNSTNRGPVDPHGRSLHGPREPPSLTSPLKTRKPQPQPAHAMAILRVPYTDPLPLPKIIPTSASTTSGAIAALIDFLLPSLSASRPYLRGTSPVKKGNGKTLLLTGAGISVASGLADYRGAKGTYTQNKSYRPVYYHEFCENHEARKRYWARSFLGWTNLDKAKPNKAHEACGDLGRLGVVGKVITQST